MMGNRYFYQFFVVLLFFASAGGAAADSEGAAADSTGTAVLDSAGTTGSDADAAAAESADREKESDIRELRENTILYGIESQVGELIVQLKEEENDRYNKLLADLYMKTSNDNLRTGILDMFTSQKDDALVDYVHGQSEDYEDLSSQLVLSLIGYLTEFQNPDITETFFTLIEARNLETASRAIQAIGKSGREENGARLLELTENEDFREELESSVIQALGQLEYTEAVNYLSDIAEDEDQSNSLRWRACEALGKIGGEQALGTVKKLLNAEDSYLRAYAVGALRGFEGEDTYDILVDALRDDFWRVRVQALEAIGERADSRALDVLEYKVRHDPDVRNVRLAALKAIGAIGTKKGYDILRDLYSNQKVSPILRNEAVRILVENSLTASMKTIEEVIAEEWGKENSLILDYTCKQLSLTESNSLVGLYEKMLTHPKSINIQIYGLRGIRLNRFGSLKAQVEKMTEAPYARSVRQLAESVLSEL